MPRGASDSNEPVQPAASTSTAHSGNNYPKCPPFLFMTHPPFLSIGNSDCSPKGPPSRVILPRNHSAMRLQGRRAETQRVGPDEETVVTHRSEPWFRNYWKTVIGTYMVHFMRHNDMVDDRFDLSRLWRLDKFPKGYELYSKPRLGNTRTADKYLFGFDTEGNRIRVFDSPMTFVLHAVSLAFGSIENCQCCECDEGTEQRNIRRMLLSIGPRVKIPATRTFKYEWESRPSASRAPETLSRPSSPIAEETNGDGPADLIT